MRFGAIYPFFLCETLQAQAYVETDCSGLSSGSFDQRRTSTLSNAAVIWDFSGNLWNWVDYVNANDKPTPAINGSLEFTAVSGSLTSPKSHLVPLNSVQPWWNDSWNSAQGIGKIYPAPNGVGGRLVRGATWTSGSSSAGLFGMDLGGGSLSYVGFRCAWRP